MIFNSIEFIGLLGLILLIYKFSKTQKQRISILFIGSSVFYAYLFPPYLLILYSIIIIDFFAAKMIFEAKKEFKKLILIISISTNLLILLFFKYSNFLFEVFAPLIEFKTPGLIQNLILPIGLSFHTFQSLSYVIETYRLKITPTKSLLKYSTYVMFFPQLVAGPIERPQNVLPQFDKLGSLKKVNFSIALRHIIIGLFKKVVLADNIAGFISQGYANPYLKTESELVLIVILFSFQIYYDFSGYSQMAIGLGKIFGVDLMKNFDKPYSARNLKEFWDRWHISLSTWFRDYVYIPLGGNRRGPYRTYYNILLVFVVSGLWHGANYTFILWGLFHGIILVIQNKLKLKADFEKVKIIDFVRVIINFYIVSILWIFFRAESISSGLEIVKRVVFPSFSFRDINLDEFTTVIIFILISFEAINLFTRYFKYLNPITFHFLRYSYYFILGSMIILLGNWGKVTFIYFQF